MILQKLLAVMTAGEELWDFRSTPNDMELSLLLSLILLLLDLIIVFIWDKLIATSKFHEHLLKFLGF
jgi:hypothetical protein